MINEEKRLASEALAKQVTQARIDRHKRFEEGKTVEEDPCEWKAFHADSVFGVRPDCARCGREKVFRTICCTKGRGEEEEYLGPFCADCVAKAMLDTEKEKPNAAG